MTTEARGSRAEAQDRSLNVLVVDDSAVARQVMTAILSKHARINVAVAADPVIAMEKMGRNRPDVIVLDLMMPRMDGMTFLAKLMSEDPIPVVVCSALTGEGSEAAFRALDEGAVDILGKPKLGVEGFLEETAESLIETIFAASTARLRPRGIQNQRGSGGSAPATHQKKRTVQGASQKVIAVGTSTGGPAALKILLDKLPADCPGVVVVQHMPEVFTAALAQRLDSGSKLEVKEAADGDLVRRGRVLIAPGNRHMLVRRRGGQFHIQLEDGPRVGRHRPSVDVLFRSVANAVGTDAVGVLLTGMGSDGANGLFDMKMAGAHCIAQDEASSVVFGMPKQAIGQGATDRVASLNDIPSHIMNALRRK